VSEDLSIDSRHKLSGMTGWELGDDDRKEHFGNKEHDGVRNISD